MTKTEARNREAIARCMARHAPVTVRFMYQAAIDGVPASREVEPYEIKGDTLFGVCCAKQEIRQFKLAKMSEVTEGEVFTPTRAVVVPC